jgi:mannose-binding lectin 1
MCFRAENVRLPNRGYFGISAATGGLADDHDVFHFLTTSLHPPGAIDAGATVPQNDQDKLSQEYQEYQKKLEQQKEEYQKEHPDQKKEDNFEDWFESENDRELRQIWQAQSSTNDVLKELSKKLDEVIGRQERTLSLISVGGQQLQQGQQPPPPGGHPQAQVQIDTIRRNEVDSLMNTQQLLTNSMREIKQTLNDLNQRAEAIIQAQKQGAGTAGGSGYEMHTIVSEMRDGMNQVKQGLHAMGNKVHAAPQVAPCPSNTCAGLTPILIALAVQLIIILGYNMYRDNKESRAKKFY